MRRARLAFALIALFDLHDGFFCIDCDDWAFRNRTDQPVEITPLYTGKDGVDHVVPHHGWTQTKFGIPQGTTRIINLVTGDFPFDRPGNEAR